MNDILDATRDSGTAVVDLPPAVPEVRPGAGIDYERFLDCVHCGLCTSACPTYLETGNENDSPRGRIYLMRAVTDGRLELTGTVKRHLDLCLDCRSCETACPSGVQYGRLIEPFRVDIERAEAARGKKPGWFRRLFLYGIFPYPNRMRWLLLPARLMQLVRLDRLLDATRLTRLLPGPLRRMQSLLPRLRSRPPRLPELVPAEGQRRARVALFTGCVAEAMFPETNRATARVLAANGCDVLIPRNQQCCGAIHYHSGAGEPALAFANANVQAFHPDDVDAIIVNVAGCGSMLKDYGHVAHELAPENQQLKDSLGGFAAKVKDVSEFLAKLGPRPPAGEVRLKATYHDACHLVHAQKVRSQPRELLSLVPGLELIPLPESDICCGAAGSYNLTEPEMADRLARRKLENILATGAEAVITGNAGCALQIHSALRQSGERIPVLHPMDVLDRAYRAAERGQTLLRTSDQDHGAVAHPQRGLTPAPQRAEDAS
ncbi:MAG: 4Fe-4S dicluster domain-containing protein [Planctomycetes bacterium]|nr:4Fe-4S dicluster domain-containing protein [Planctomycetota bacterium]